MTAIGENRKICLKQQSELRQLFNDPEKHQEAIDKFLHQHAMLHAGRISQMALWSYEDALLDQLSDQQFRLIPSKSDHSIAWIFWHITRIEDVAMNILVAGDEQVFNRGNWYKKLNAAVVNTGNAMEDRDIAELSNGVQMSALRDYRYEVGCRTREIVHPLTRKDVKAKVDPERLQRVMDEGALLEGAVGIKEYWGKRDIAGLLLMPASRHILVHLNEAQTLLKKLKKGQS